VVVVINAAHAFDARIADGARALMVVWYPGEAFGLALASVVAGQREPSGRLPLAIARSEADYSAFSAVPDEQGRLAYTEGSGIGYRGMIARGVEPLHAFGTGMGYGNIVFDEVRLHRPTNDKTILLVDVQNVAAAASAAVVQAYRSDGALAGFSKAIVAGHGRATIPVELDHFAFRRWVDGVWRMPDEPVDLRVGWSSADLPLSISINFNQTDGE
jgi:beta-glucosidase